ncbi:MAG: DNA-3-methyladenine glycosylase [bacterium]|nr:DNA-3-methyladenine glycosylase [bacterium]
MRKILEKDFFNRDTATVARELLGKFLVRKMGNQEMSAMITETEAYDGPEDKASHASKGMTKRTEIMFDHPGNWYVYLIYGMYDMLNVVTREHGYPAAVLIRGVIGHDGPGKVTKFLRITRDFNGKMAEKSTGLWFEERGALPAGVKIKKLPRLGVNYAGPIWAAKKLRFILEL